MITHTYDARLSTLLFLCVMGLMAPQETHAQPNPPQQATTQQPHGDHQPGVKRQAYSFSGGSFRGFGFALIAIGVGPVFIASTVGLISNASFIGRKDPGAWRGKRTWGIYGITTGASLMCLSLIPFLSSISGSGTDPAFLGIGIGTTSVGAATLGMGIANLTQSKKMRKKPPQGRLPLASSQGSSFHARFHTP